MCLALQLTTCLLGHQPRATDPLQSLYTQVNKRDVKQNKTKPKNPVKQERRALEEIFADWLILEIKYTAAGSRSLCEVNDSGDADYLKDGCVLVH